eukprot:Protomagalhaensia_wolfi_Nauph_80__1741@NODE_2084_length_1219_cov_64_506780_g1629_i0_p1_GENE_NODE_2084_length_1219_cov_64_506780_g1629_i0NODE_2084_length_1219_cov_64_506780_g1629_i0_p1_ORF_typecomplete_len357_score42_78_NODE_2084_length_1219_cov_64_506780_g1629_i0451115
MRGLNGDDSPSSGFEALVVGLAATFQWFTTESGVDFAHEVKTGNFNASWSLNKQPLRIEDDTLVYYFVDAGWLGVIIPDFQAGTYVSFSTNRPEIAALPSGEPQYWWRDAITALATLKFVTGRYTHYSHTVVCEEGQIRLDKNESNKLDGGWLSEWIQENKKSPWYSLPRYLPSLGRAVSDGEARKIFIESDVVARIVQGAFPSVEALDIVETLRRESGGSYLRSHLDQVLGYLCSRKAHIIAKEATRMRRPTVQEFYSKEVKRADLTASDGLRLLKCTCAAAIQSHPRPGPGSFIRNICKDLEAVRINGVSVQDTVEREITRSTQYVEKHKSFEAKIAKQFHKYQNKSHQRQQSP